VFLFKFKKLRDKKVIKLSTYIFSKTNLPSSFELEVYDE